MSSLRILIAEDDPFYADSLRQVMERGGYDVVGVAADARHALSLATARQPDLALVDVNLRDGCTGPDLGRRLAREGLRVLFVTGEPDRAPVGEPGIVGALTKPAGDAALLDAVRLIAMPEPPGQEVPEGEDGASGPQREAAVPLADLLHGLVRHLHSDARALAGTGGTAERAAVLKTRAADIAALTLMSPAATRAAQHVAEAADRALAVKAESEEAGTIPGDEQASHAINLLEEPVSELAAAAEAFLARAAPPR